jgi:hypothetical protein
VEEADDDIIHAENVRVAVDLVTCCNRTMDVRGVGAGPTGPELSSALRGLPGLKGQGTAGLGSLAQPGDTTTAILRELSEPKVVRFLEILELPPTPEIAARLGDLIRASVSAAAEGNVELALAKLAEFAALNPRFAETLETEPGLASIRVEVGRLLFQLASTAQLNAEIRLGEATHFFHTAGSGELPGQEIKPEIAILIAGRFLEAGGYANSMRSTEVSQMLINQYGWAPVAVPLPIADPRSIFIRSAHVRVGLRNQWMSRIKQLWLRAPLLILLLVWFAVGFLGGSVFALLRKYWPQTRLESLGAGGFEVWAVGFLALIAYGFYARVRNIRW